MGMYTAWRNRGPSPTSGADEAPRDEGKPVKSPPGAQSLSIRPFLLLIFLRYFSTVDGERVERKNMLAVLFFL